MTTADELREVAGQTSFAHLETRFSARAAFRRLLDRAATELEQQGQAIEPTALDLAAIRQREAAAWEGDEFDANLNADLLRASVADIEPLVAEVERLQAEPKGKG